MSETNDPTPETTATTDAPDAPDVPAAPPKRTLRDRLATTGERLRGTRGLIAATLAALIVGGFAGAAIHAAVDGDRHEHGRFFFPGPGGVGRDFDPRGPGDFDHRAPGGLPGQLPPTTPPSPVPRESPSESSDS